MRNKKIIKIKGGLGNQLFQYAHGRKCIEKGEEVVFDISFFEENKKDTLRPFLLNKFNILETNIFLPLKESIIKKYLNKIKSKLSGEYGFFQSEKYFKGIEPMIRKEFTLKDPLSQTAQTYADQIQQNHNSVSIHIRRGDYVLNSSANKHHGVCDLEYYERAISKIKELIDSPAFFIFSDDIEWVRENLKVDNAIYVSNPSLSECEEMMLMSYCKHNIIANSTFSWWGAWLNQNPNKIVIAPQKWLNTDTSNQPDIIPPTWIKI
jgi:hypothetical protein